MLGLPTRDSLPSKQAVAFSTLAWYRLAVGADRSGTCVLYAALTKDFASFTRFCYPLRTKDFAFFMRQEFTNSHHLLLSPIPLLKARVEEIRSPL